MKISELHESTAASTLAKKLPKLKAQDYDTIDALMKDICAKFDISGKELHDRFVKQYNATPDDWVKEKHPLNESIETPEDAQIIKRFINWTLNELNMDEPYPKWTFSDDHQRASKQHHTGAHTPSENHIWIYVGNRNIIDICRTIAHELVHVRQGQINMIRKGVSYPGSPVEMLADMVAGKLIKVYAKDHPEIYQ